MVLGEFCSRFNFHSWALLPPNPARQQTAEKEGTNATGGLSPYEALYLGLDGDLLRRFEPQHLIPTP